MYKTFISSFCTTLLFFNSIQSLSSHPKLLLISFDGFRFDLLTEELVPNIYKWSQTGTWFTSGVKSQYTTITAPNHMSIVTGMYQESHGIVGNYFMDPENNQFFDYFNDTTHPGALNSSESEYWYKADPIWLTNERFESTRSSASVYWPNGESPFPYEPYKPKYSKKWKELGNLETWLKDADEVIDLFTRTSDPYNFVAWYICDPDHVLHTNGFHNGELVRKLTELDTLFQYFIGKLEENNMGEHVNVILTADHGHAEIKSEKHVMCIKDYVDETTFLVGDHMIYPNSEKLGREIYKNLTEAIKTDGFGVKIHWKDELPEKWHYSKSRRIGNIVIEPKIGSDISFSCTKEQMDMQYGPNGITRFNSSGHGMSPDYSEMKAFLVMKGPVFLENHQISDVPENIDLYNLMCHVLGITPTQNNGTMEIVKKALGENFRFQLDSQEYRGSMKFTFVLVFPTLIAILGLAYGCRHTVLNANIRKHQLLSEYRRSSPRNSAFEDDRGRKSDLEIGKETPRRMNRM